MRSLDVVLRPTLEVHPASASDSDSPPLPLYEVMDVGKLPAIGVP
ncbi:MAG TPA: hypothetical protein VFA89_14300 [Terriglobales bacterium]|nr:hypothetical protein [Terriglobales bacterium]